MFKRFVTAIEILTLVGFVVFVAMLFVKQPATVATQGPPSAGSSSSVASSSSGATAPDGASLYADNCASCHGGRGQGGVGPKLGGGAAAREFPNAADEERFVTDGGSGMPAFGRELSPQEITAIVQFTRTTLGG